MSLYQIAAVLLGLVALVGYLNHRLLGLPSTMGSALIALTSSLVLLVTDALVPGLRLAVLAERCVVGIDFNEALMVGMLTFLLFAGALHQELDRRWAIGIEVLAVSREPLHLAAGLIAIPVVLVARFLSVGLPVALLSALGRPFDRHTVPIPTWSGLSGGIGVALVLSLPPFAGRELVVTITYVVVLFSILGQGFTVRWVFGRLLGPARSEAEG